MNASTLIKSVFLAASLAAGVAHADPSNLIVNGSFEADSQAYGTWNIYAGLTGWSSGKYGIELRNHVAGDAFDGHNFIELDTTRNSLAYQKIDTTYGQQYTLSFAYSPRPGVDKASNGIEVLWNGEELGVVKASGKHNAANDWQVYTLEVFGGQKDFSKLEFKAVGTSDSYGGSLDAVSLTSAVPEPATYSMVLLGVGLISFAGRRQRTPKFTA